MECTKTCVLCFEQILNNSEKLDFDKIGNIRSLVNLDITASEEAIICSKCADICQKSFSFKTTCLSNHGYLKTFNHSNHNKLILEAVIVKKIKCEVKCEEEKVCYFCLNYFEATSAMEVKVEQDAFIKDMLEKCLPELDINVENPLICFNCIELLKVCFDFISCCEVSVLVKNINKNPGKVDLNAVIPNTENVDNTTDYNLIKIEAEHVEKSIETEYQIKTEEEDLDIEEDHKEFVITTLKESDNHLKEIDDEALTSNTVKSKERKYACTLCPYRAQHKRTLQDHYQVHQELTDTVGFKCDKCLYITTKKTNLIMHSLQHKNPSEVIMFKCEQCPYETKRKGNLRNHLVIHKSPSEVLMYKCAECSYQTRHKACFRRHKKIHLKASDSSEQEVFICNECNFLTKSKKNLVTHVKCHLEVKAKQFITSQNLSNSLETVETNSSDNNFTEMFSCDSCFYSTPQKCNLVNHCLIHKNLSDIRQFKCNKCPFVAKRKSNMAEHQMVHQDIAERKRYNCSECQFEALSRSTVTRHKRNVHGQSDDKYGKLKKYICHECGFETIYRKSILCHLAVHRQGLTPRNEYRKRCSMLDREKLYKCNICEYESKDKKTFGLHLITHKDPSNMSMHKCAVCATECKYKRSLQRHIQNHMSKDDLEMHQCQDCDYRGVNLFYLEQHYIKKHKKDVGEILYSCKGCEYRGKDKIELLLHRKTHQMMVYKCEHCTFKSQSHYEYMVHSKGHSDGSEIVREYKCDSCKFETKHFSGFLLHLKSHEVPKRSKRKLPVTEEEGADEVTD